MPARNDGDGGTVAPGAPQLAPLTFSVSWFRLIGTGLLAALFVAIGLFMCVASTEWDSKIIGLVCVLFFGGGYGAVLWKKLRAPIVLAVSEDGIKPQSGGFIPWEDFEAALDGFKALPEGRKSRNPPEIL